MAKVTLSPTVSHLGDTTTSSYRVPILTSGQTSHFYLDCTKSDLLNASLRFTLALEVSDDNVKWRRIVQADMVGGAYDWDEPPSIGVATEKLKGKYVRVYSRINRTTNAGIILEDLTGDTPKWP